MRELRGKVAVVTGGAAGLGLAMAARFADEGMKLVLADVDEPALSEAEQALRSRGVAVLAVPTDVSNASDVEQLARRALEAFGAIHLVINNAGVSPLGPVWENSTADWQWALGVNLWGVIHGVRVFTPLLLANGEEGHIVNTASIAGLISPPGMGIYNVTKHAVVALTETLQHDLARHGGRIACSVLCPAYVPTGIADSERSRPAGLHDAKHEKSAAQLASEAQLKKAVHSGRLSADDVAQVVVAAVRERRFYILTHARVKGAIEARMQDILEERAPRDPLTLK
jgi:NAD(P)-dependent dehydrogenase (short-subunit alcohol dehydrogenase family)